jgi:hypothetical protein
MIIYHPSDPQRMLSKSQVNSTERFFTTSAEERIIP